MNNTLPFKLICLLILFFGCSPKKEVPKTPNFVFILVDDLGYYDLGYQGSAFYETPNIDHLAENSMRFTQGYAACQVCSPSRASIMTGLFPDRHGITDYIGAPMGESWNSPPWGEVRGTQMLPPTYLTQLPHALPTLPEALLQAGYRTFFAGKWHLGGEGSFPEDHGFEANIGGNHQGGPYPGGFFAPFQNPQMPEGEPGESLTLRLAQETASFIEQNKTTPFFAFLSFYAVHAPIQTTQQHWQKYRDKAEKLGFADEGFAMEKRFPIRIAQDNPVYAGMVETVDSAVGMVINALQEAGIADNTVIVFTSDNGGVSSGDDFATALLPLRGGKGYQWEGGLRVPLLIRVPWLKAAVGTTSHEPVSGVDFFPTLLNLADIGIQDLNIDGTSLLPVLGGDTLAERPLFWHYPHYGNQGGDPCSIVRQGPWKLIYYHETGNSALYHLEQDPSEQTDLAAEHAQTTESLKKTLMNRLAQTGALFPSPNPSYDPDRLAEKIRQRNLVQRVALEQKRQAMAQPSWQPNADWWGSQQPPID